MINFDLFKSNVKKLGITLDNAQINKFNKYINFLIECNKKINLTAIKDEKDIINKHFIDSLTLLSYIGTKKSLNIIDIGSGAGFPGIPLKIVNENINLTMLDALGKRINFLAELSSELDLDYVTIHGRAEELSHDLNYRESFDIATARAVTELNKLCEYCIPYVKPGGYFIAMKGPNIKDELDASFNAIEKLGGKLKNIHNITLPDKSERNIIIIEKITKTIQAYPRKNVKIIKNPL